MSANSDNIVPVLKLSEVNEQTPPDCYKLVLDDGTELGYAVIEQIHHPKPLTNLRMVIRAETLQNLEKDRERFERDYRYFEGQAIDLRRELHESRGTAGINGLPGRTDPDRLQ